MAERWIIAAIRKNLPDIITKYLSTECGQATKIEQTQSIATTRLHDYRTGLPRGQGGSMLHLIQDGDTTRDNEENQTKEDDQPRQQTTADRRKEFPDSKDGDLGAVVQGKGKSVEKSKGYGKC